jgi:hypothetical protein
MDIFCSSHTEIVFIAELYFFLTENKIHLKAMSKQLSGMSFRLTPTERHRTVN